MPTRTESADRGIERMPHMQNMPPFHGGVRLGRLCTCGTAGDDDCHVLY